MWWIYGIDGSSAELLLPSSLQKKKKKKKKKMDRPRKSLENFQSSTGQTQSSLICAGAAAFMFQVD